MTNSTPQRREKRVKAWAVIGHGNLLGSGQRGQHYIYWDKEDADAYVTPMNGVMRLMFKKMKFNEATDTWKVIPCTITYTLPKKPLTRRSK
jgi:hypothetical protein